jgi:hypothetical protein
LKTKRDSPIAALAAEPIPWVKSGDKRLMRLARFVWTLELLLVLGLAGFVAGCDSGVRQAAPLDETAKGKSFAEERKQMQKDRINAKRAARGLKPIESPESGQSPKPGGGPA